MARLPWLLVAALALALGMCSFHRVRLRSYYSQPEPEAPPEDALISLQGSRPVDTDGNQVRAWRGGAGRAHDAAEGLLPARSP